MKDKFIGGKGLALVSLECSDSETRWNDPENEIVIAHGPVAGITQYQVQANLGGYFISTDPYAHGQQCGGYFGPYLKFSGFDALGFRARRKKDVIIYIDGNKV